MPFGESIQAAVADVEYRTNLGVFRAEQEQVQAVYARTTGAMSDEALKLAVAQERLNRAIAQQGPESYAAAKATVAYRAEVDSLARSETAAAAAADRAARQRLSAYAGAARTVGSTLTRYVTVPTALLAAAAVKMGVDFQQQMLLVQTQAGASASEVHKLSGEVIQLAHVAPQGPVELAKGLYPLESLGLRGATALHTLRISALAAGMGIADLESTATALGAVVVTGIQGAQNYGQAMGTLVGTVGSGNVRMEDLATSIGNVAPAAAAAGVSLTELGAAYATLTDRGFSADEAATRLRMAFALIQSPSAKATKALADMGINAEQLGATLREPNGLLKVLEELHAGIDRVGKVRGNRDLLAGFGGGRSGLGIQTLVQSLDSSVSSYAQKIGQVDAQSKKFAENQKAYLQSVGYQLHHDLASIEADLTKAGTDIAPAVNDAATAVTKLVDAFGHLPGFVKTDLGVLAIALAAGGPIILGIAAVIRGVKSIGDAWAYMSGSATKAITTTDEQLALLRAQAAQTAAALEAAGAEGGAGLAAGIGTGVAKSEAELTGLAGAETAAGAGGLLGRIGGLGGLTGIRAAGAYGLGGLLAGQVIGSAIPGQAGQSLGAAAQLAGLGATVGSFVGPEGTLVGAGLGAIVGGLASVIHEGPSFTQQMDSMGQSIDRFHEATAATASAILSLRQQIANDRVGRDQAQQELQAARAEERATRGTAQHAAAVDQLHAAEFNLHAANHQISTDTATLTVRQKQHADAIRKTAQAEAGLARELNGVRTASISGAQQNIVYTNGVLRARQSANEAAASMEAWKQKIAGFASSSDPKIAEVGRELQAVTNKLNHIPPSKTIRLIIDEVFNAPKNARAPEGPAGPVSGAGDYKPLPDPTKTKTRKGKYGAPFTTTIPIALQINLQRAQNAGDAASERRYLNEQLAFLQAEYRKAQRDRNQQEELQALQAIGAVESQLQSLQTHSTTRTKKRQSAYQQKVEEEANRLKINEARAQLAEKRAGANQHALDRAYRAERRTIQAEIDFYRKEAHDQELSLAARQKYAKLQIAAEEAKLKIGKQIATQTKSIKQAEAQVLADLQTILQNYAPNFFQEAGKPHVNVHVNQSFPAPPTDQHRQARHALLAMRSAFDG